MRNNRTLVLIAGGLLLLVVVGYSLFTFTGRSGKVAVDVTLFPSDTEATLNGEQLRSGTIYLEPGVYTLKGSKQGFEDLTKSVTINETQKTLVVAPKAVSPEAIKWAKDNYLEIQGEYEIEAYEMGKDFNDKNPIAKHLPYKNFLYSIGYRMDQSDPSGNSIIIEIDAMEGYRQAALYRIRQLGYDPTDFTINFRDYTNPFPL